MTVNNGEVVIFPTDTVYGIGARIDDKVAQDKIFDIKHRNTNKRLAVLCSSIDQIKQIAEVNEETLKIMNCYFPGALTLILPTKKQFISDTILDTIGVRIPNHPLALELLNQNGPMATTSVNLSSEPPMNNFEEIVIVFGDLVSKIYPNDLPLSEVSSTVINLTTNPISIIREGDIKLADILKVIHE